MILKKSLSLGLNGYKPNSTATDTNTTNTKIWTDKFLKDLKNNEEQPAIKIKKVRERKIKLKKIKRATFKENYLNKRADKSQSTGGKSIFAGFWDFVIDEIALAFGFKDPESAPTQSTKTPTTTKNTTPRTQKQEQAKQQNQFQENIREI